MIDYVKLIREYHRGRIPVGFNLFIAAPARREDIDAVREELPKAIPSELIDLYAACNGCSLDLADEKYWFFVPIKQVAALRQSTEKWYLKTHPQLKDRFHPFIDWSNGDSMGYLLSQTDELIPGLYCFEHEEYEHVSDQEHEDFIVKWNDDIRGLLTKGAGSL